MHVHLLTPPLCHHCCEYCAGGGSTVSVAWVAAVLQAAGWLQHKPVVELPQASTGAAVIESLTCMLTAGFANGHIHFCACVHKAPPSPTGPQTQKGWRPLN